MKRYVSPTSGKIVQKSNKYINMGNDDAFSAFMTSTFGTVAIFFITAFLSDMVSTWFLLIGIPWFYFLVMPWIVWGFTSVNIKNDGGYVSDATKTYQKLRGTFEETYAKPLAEQIFQHAQENHEGGRKKNRGWYDDGCKICDDRVKTLKDLIPKKKLSTSTQELEEARRFITERDKIMGELI